MKNRLNWLAIFAGAIVYMILGMVWYTAFASPWMELSGITEAQAQTAGGGPYILAFLTDIIIGIVLSWVLPRLGARTPMDGARISFLLALGLVFTTGMTTYAFSFRPTALGVIDHFYHVLSIAIVGGVITMMQRKQWAEATPQTN
jgi:hypothetical protein